MKKITVICDGSSLGNGSEGARAGAVAIMKYVDEEGRSVHKVVGEFLGNATNNQAEIIAAAIGLEALKYPCDVDIITDSRYVVETKKGNYREKKNHSYWDRLREAARPHRVKWFWTKGHNNHPIQEECDRAAKRIAARGFTDPEILGEALRRVEQSRWPATK